MKTTKINSSIFTLCVILTLGIILSSCSKENDLDAPMIHSTTVNDDLTSIEQDDLLNLLEKEKFHRDVYQTIYDANQLSFVTQFCNCDDAFMTKLSIKVDKYGLENPVANKAIGEFESANLQHRFTAFESLDLNDELVALEFARDMESEMISEIQRVLEQLDGNNDLRSIYVNIQASSEAQYDELGEQLDFIGKDDWAYRELRPKEM
jgi:hypothetical protein